jgi:hypothetical protein
METYTLFICLAVNLFMVVLALSYALKSRWPFLDDVIYAYQVFFFLCAASASATGLIVFVTYVVCNSLAAFSS